MGRCILLAWLNRAKAGRGASGVVGLALLPDGAALVHVVHQAGVPQVQACEVLRAPAEQLAAALRNRVSALGLSRTDTVLLPPASDYQLLLVNRPDVPDEELAAALRWQIRDQVAAAPESLVVDAFALPADAWRGRTSMAYCAVLSRLRMEQLATLVRSAGLRLRVIEIEEMALRNLGLCSEHDQQTLALVKLNERDALVCVQHGAELYMARRLDCGLANRGEEAATLALELQRSLDYFERQLGRGYVSRLLLLPTTLAAEPLRSELDSRLSVPVQELQLQLMSSPALLRLGRADMAACLPALGAALREGVH